MSSSTRPPPSLFHTLPPAPQEPNLTMPAPPSPDILRESMAPFDREGALSRLRARLRSLSESQVSQILNAWSAG